MLAVARAMSWVQFDILLLPGMECFELNHFQKMYIAIALPCSATAILALLKARGKLGKQTAVMVGVHGKHGQAYGSSTRILEY